jgi:transcriptional antiterminator RfaH
MMHSDEELCWRLLYTKPRAEEWVEMNLRRQGYATLLPRVRGRSGYGALFPRYVFAGFSPGQAERPIGSTRGVQYVVSCGERPALVPSEVVAEIQGRMDARGVVAVGAAAQPDPLFAKRQRERTEALLKLTQSGFRVRAG